MAAAGLSTSAPGSNPTPTIDLTGLSDPFGLNTGLTASPPMGPSQPPDYTGMGLDPFAMGGQPTDLAGNAVADTTGTPTDTTGGSTDTSGGGTTSGGGGVGDLLSGIGTALSGGIGNLGNLALFGGLYSLLQKQASNASEVNTNLANQITQIGAPDVAAGKDLLTAFQSGSLTKPYSQMVANAEAENQKAATSQMQQVSSLLANAGGGNLQSAMASEGQQITGQQALANSEAVVQAFNKELTDSLNLTSTGGAYVQSGIMQEIQSNTQLQGQLASLMGMLAQAYARSTSGGTGGAGGTGGGVVSSISKGLGGLIDKLLAKGATTTATQLIKGLDQIPGLQAGIASTDTTLAQEANQVISQIASTADPATQAILQEGEQNLLADAASSAAPDLGTTADTIDTLLSGDFSSAASGGGAAADTAALGPELPQIDVTASALPSADAAAADVAGMGPTDVAGGSGAASLAGLGWEGVVGAAAPALIAGLGLYGIGQSLDQTAPAATYTSGNGVVADAGKTAQGNSIAAIGGMGIGAGNNYQGGTGQMYVNRGGTWQPVQNQSQVSGALSQAYGALGGINIAQTSPENVTALLNDTQSSFYTGMTGQQYLDAAYQLGGGAAGWGVDQATWQNNLFKLWGQYNTGTGNPFPTQ
jgi:hypothetical protein